MRIPPHLQVTNQGSVAEVVAEVVAEGARAHVIDVPDESCRRGLVV